MIKVTWIDRFRVPVVPPDPKYPNGIEVDLTGGAADMPSCKVELPYPAKRLHSIQRFRNQGDFGSKERCQPSWDLCQRFAPLFL